MLMVLLGLLLLFAGGNAIVMVRAAIAQRAWPRAEAAVLGAVVNFLDTLGIGSMAPTMAWFKFRKMVPDQLIPHTMIAGLTLPTVVEGLIFLQLLGVSVDPVLLIGCILALLAGGWCGIPLVSRARLWVVQALVAAALLLAATFYILSNLDLMPLGGTASSLPPGLTIVAILMNFGFGVLLNFGVGNYAPTLALLSLMGLDPRLCFPIMAAGASFTGAVIGGRQMHDGKIDLRIAGAMVLAGIPAVLVAALVVKSLPLVSLRWLVSVVIIYTGIVMLRAAAASRRAERENAAAGA
ncbi:TSUP family transporter [Sandarakinorhabdus sp. AAP62]|uniref:TSUP family transporter n=1 Tax=Sandarakinorhabdus sp. AAP62 TaxID=1248916 RepID=UPI0002DBD7CC|nr:TSUP family transporter [Sandarakinorhabdus sp. AAP62]